MLGKALPGWVSAYQETIQPIYVMCGGEKGIKGLDYPPVGEVGHSNSSNGLVWERSYRSSSSNPKGRILQVIPIVAVKDSQANG